MSPLTTKAERASKLSPRNWLCLLKVRRHARKKASLTLLQHFGPGTRHSTFPSHFGLCHAPKTFRGWFSHLWTRQCQPPLAAENNIDSKCHSRTQQPAMPSRFATTRKLATKAYHNFGDTYIVADTSPTPLRRQGLQQQILSTKLKMTIHTCPL